MRSTWKMIFFGFIVWLFPFFVSLLIFPLKETNLAFFETIIPLTITLITVVMTTGFFRKIRKGHLRHIQKRYLQIGIILGIIWVFICFFFDLLLFSFGPIKMTFSVYMSDIGFSYLIIPIITIGFGNMLERKTY
ncbi:MAG: hypothetical protein HQ534_04025 [Armatimonadetes bacterium]|nr:hypothetical protein [Armatimonadota bacterium]